LTYGALSGSSSITVRRAAAEEYERVGALTLAAYRALSVDHLWGGYDSEILDTRTRAEHSDVLVAVTDDDRVVGSVTYVADSESTWSEWTEPGEAQFRLLAVDLDARGLGAGGALVKACTTRAASDRQTILFHTTPWMETAQRIYARLGFIRRVDRDVPYEAWNHERHADLAPEWIDQPFLAYSWSGR